MAKDQLSIEWTCSQALMAGLPKPSIPSHSALSCSLKAGTAAARLASLNHSHQATLKLQDSRKLASLMLSPFSRAQGWLCTAASGHVGIWLRSKAGCFESEVTQPSWLWPWQKMRVRAGQPHRVTRHLFRPESFDFFSWRMKTVKNQCSEWFNLPKT